MEANQDSCKLCEAPRARWLSVVAHWWGYSQHGPLLRVRHAAIRACPAHDLTALAYAVTESALDPRDPERHMAAKAELALTLDGAYLQAARMADELDLLLRGQGVVSGSAVVGCSAVAALVG